MRVSAACTSEQQPIKGIIQVCERCAFDRIVVISARKQNHALFTSVSLNHEPVKARRDHFIFFREQKDRGRMNRLRICNTVEISRNLQRDGTRQQPEIPPAKLTQDHLAERRRIMQDQSGNPSMRSNMERGGCAETRAVEHNWLAIRTTLQFVERRERCRPDPRKPRWPGAAAESGIIHSPDFDCSIVPFVGFRSYPALRAVRVAIEPQNVRIHAAILLRSTRYCRP